MIVTVSGLSGLTNAYRSVLSATGSFEISGASQCENMRIPPKAEFGEIRMSSHREAPEISKDPIADNTDLYAFVSPDQPDTVTIITNYIPLQDPAGGPN